MKSPKILVLSLAVVCTGAFAQYSWIGADGKKVYSDRPPAAADKVNKVQRQSLSSSKRLARQRKEAAAAEKEAAKSGGNAVVDKKLEAEKKKQEAAAAEAKKAEEDKLASARAENCSNARRYKSTLDSGVRVIRNNDKGEREVLNDAQRSDEQKRIQDVISDNC